MDFFTACLNGDIDFAINVVNTIDLKSDVAKINLLTSIVFNRKTVVKRFLELNIPVKFSEQGLIYAVYLGKIEIVELFLNNKIDVNCENDKGETPLFNALVNEKKDVLQMLVSAGVQKDVLFYNKITPLMIATCKKDKEIIDLFINSESSNLNGVNHENSSIPEAKEKEKWLNLLKTNIDEFNLFKKILPKNETIDLSYCDLTNMNLKEADLLRCDLSFCDFSNSEINLKFTLSRLEKTNFKNAIYDKNSYDAKHIPFIEALWEGEKEWNKKTKEEILIYLMYFDFSKKNFENYNLKNVNFTFSNLSYCDFSKAKFKDTHLDKTILNNAIFKKAFLNKVFFDNSIINKSTFDGTVFEFCDFKFAKVKDSSFDFVFFKSYELFHNTVFENCTFDNSSFLNSSLIDTKFINCSFKNTKFDKTDLEFACFENCDLTNSKTKLYN